MKLLVKLAAILAVSSPFSVAVKNINTSVIYKSDEENSFSELKKINKNLKTFTVDSQRIIYFVTEDNIIYRFDKNRNDFVEIQKIDDEVLNLIDILDGNIYAVCKNGIYKSDGKSIFTVFDDISNITARDVIKKIRKYFLISNIKMIPFLNNSWLMQENGTDSLNRKVIISDQGFFEVEDQINNSIIGQLERLVVVSFNIGSRNKLYVATDKNKIYQIDDGVVFIKRLSGQIKDWIADARGNIYIAMAGGAVYKYNTNNHDTNDFTMIKGIVGSIVKLAVDSRDNIYAIEYCSGRLYKSDGTNDFVVSGKRFWGLKDLTIDNNDNVYLLDCETQFSSFIKNSSVSSKVAITGLLGAVGYALYQKL